MHSRYADPTVAKIWSSGQRVQRWLLIERAHLRVLGWDASIKHYDTPIHYEVNAAEARTGHDVGAFLEVLEQRLVHPQAQRWLHYGLTSSDLVDTGNAMAANETTGYLATLAATLRKAFDTIPDGLVVQGRTHGQPAAATTVRGRWRPVEEGLFHNLPDPLPAMFSGAVGQHCILSRRTEKEIADVLGMRAVDASTQVIPRSEFHRVLYRWLEWIQACEQIALDVRLMSAFGDCNEPRQGVGSTAMPHKVNPIRAEKICGLARVARGLFHAELEGAALWLDRDLSHSSVDRIAFEDLGHLAAHALSQTTTLLRTLEWHPQPLTPEADSAHRLALATKSFDWPRSVAYRWVRDGVGADSGAKEVTPESVAATPAPRPRVPFDGGTPE